MLYPSPVLLEVPPIGQEVLADRLRTFFADWRALADTEGMNILDVAVPLVYILFDFCKLVEVDPVSVLGEHAEAI